MKAVLFSLLHKVAFAFCRGFSLLPLRVLYFLSDALFFPLYYVVRYRRGIVRGNLCSSFPEKSRKEIVAIEKRYYRFFCDYLVETLKLFSIGEAEMKRRMHFENPEVVEEVLRSGRSCSLCLGHYCNWEWVSSLPASIGGERICAQIYHPLENPMADKLFLYMRGRFGAKSVTQDDTFRHIMEWQKKGEVSIVGYIADQVPGYNNIHYWADFLHHDTPVFTGPERMARLTDAAVFYLDVFRTRRGYYTGRFVLITDRPSDCPRFEITAQYFRLLEASIQRAPQFWLWSHNRWKRSREEFERLYSPEERKKRLSRL